MLLGGSARGRSDHGTISCLRLAGMNHSMRFRTVHPHSHRDEHEIESTKGSSYRPSEGCARKCRQHADQRHGPAKHGIELRPRWRERAEVWNPHPLRTTRTTRNAAIPIPARRKSVPRAPRRARATPRRHPKHQQTGYVSSNAEWRPKRRQRSRRWRSTPSRLPSAGSDPTANHLVPSTRLLSPPIFAPDPPAGARSWIVQRRNRQPMAGARRLRVPARRRSPQPYGPIRCDGDTECSTRCLGSHAPYLRSSRLHRWARPDRYVLRQPRTPTHRRHWVLEYRSRPFRVVERAGAPSDRHPASSAWPSTLVGRHDVSRCLNP